MNDVGKDPGKRRVDWGPLTAVRRWIEVLIVVVAGAGTPREIPVPNTIARARTGGTIWSNNQDSIVQQVRKAEEIWGVRILHGKAIGGVWKDFIVVSVQN